MKRIMTLTGSALLVLVIVASIFLVHPLIWTNLSGVMSSPFGIPTVIHDEFFNDPGNLDSFRPVSIYEMPGVLCERTTRELLTGEDVLGVFDVAEEFDPYYDMDYAVVQDFEKQCLYSIFPWLGIAAIIWLSIHITRKRRDMMYFIPWSWVVLLSTPMVCQLTVSVFQYLNGTLVTTVAAIIPLILYYALWARDSSETTAQRNPSNK